MARPSKYVCGWCSSELAHDDRYPKVHCWKVREARTVVKNTTAGTKIVELERLVCSCSCVPVPEEGSE